MTIEVRQLLVKSTVTEGDRAAKGEHLDPSDLEEWKEELMRECRRMIESRLRETKER